jgi:hypothetical protein
VPELTETVQHGVYQGFIAPVALYGFLAGMLIRNRRRNGDHEPTTDQEVKEHE